MTTFDLNARLNEVSLVLEWTMVLIAQKVLINCFTHNPLASSIIFFRDSKIFLFVDSICLLVCGCKIEDGVKAIWWGVRFFVYDFTITSSSFDALGWFMCSTRIPIVVMGSKGSNLESSSALVFSSRGIYTNCTFAKFSHNCLTSPLYFFSRGSFT